MRSIAIMLLLLLVSACAHVPPKPAEEGDTQVVGGITLTRVFRSATPSPDWAKPGFLAENATHFLATGKGSRLDAPISAQQVALHEAIAALLHGRFGADAKFKTNVELVPVGPKFLLRMQALIWFGPEPTLLTGFEVSGAYNETWSGNGQSVFVSFVRITWPKATYEETIRKQSI